MAIEISTIKIDRKSYAYIAS